MNRFKIVCDSSDQSQEESRTTKRGRQRPARTKKVNQDPADKKQNNKEQSSQQRTEKKQPSKLFKKQQIQRQQNQNAISQFINTNEHKNTSSLNSQQKFIRQKIKSVQIQLQQIVQKIIITKKQRSKYYNACRLAAKDLQKINKQIQKLKSNSSTQTNLTKSQLKNNKNQQLQSMLQLQYKVSSHISKLLKQHQKTIQLILQCRKSMQRIFNPIKYQFLTLQNIEIWNQSAQQMKQYGVGHIYELLNKADDELEMVTQFNV